MIRAEIDGLVREEEMSGAVAGTVADAALEGVGALTVALEEVDEALFQHIVARTWAGGVIPRPVGAAATGK